METSSPDHIWIDTANGVISLARQLEGAKAIAVDLEADSMHHFRERVCLVQIGAPGVQAVIDPLAVSDLSPLRPVFADDDVQKIFHGADYDIRSLYRDFHIEVRNLFDTQVAAMFAGMRETGLDAVAQRLLGVTLDKRFQKKNWSRRPLPREMVAYAAEDVRHLVPLARLLTESLSERGRLAWVLEECRLLSGVRPADNDGQPLFLRFRGAGTLDRRRLAVLEELLKYRVDVAAKKDRPLFKVMGNQAMLEIAKAAPLNPTELEHTGALSTRQFQMYGTDLVNAVHRGMAVDEADLPIYPRKRAPRVPATVPARVLRVKAWRDTRAQDLDLDPSLICTRAQMTAMAIANPKSVEALSRIPEIKDWQKNAFGPEIIGALKANR
jgi:ribonuclease D